MRLLHRHALLEYLEPVQDDVDCGRLCGLALSVVGLDPKEALGVRRNIVNTWRIAICDEITI